ncbi:MAG: nicotinamide-nucleotide amidohydrolase family protein [Neisseria sp.]|uniref:CinA family protein n=1 Tax=Neisseria sp. TaxID=192066 RepID=UPI0026DCA3DB|nr:nicotinamide-nucleotide amidohydrolase family protein [Neisseria sp.]MDO4247368.1 nicotinamide-nucleotide amidohydrolase family protein [Neisseria sp.]
MMNLQNIAERLMATGKSVSCAESCTGGLLAAEFTRLPGSSAWFHMSWVTYSNEAKQRLLGVLPHTLETHGAVSEETVREMADGALRLANADYALSISGIAGPDGGSAQKPVGTVCFGLATRQTSFARRMHFTGDRDAVRAQAVAFALQWLAQELAD